MMHSRESGTVAGTGGELERRIHVALVLAELRNARRLLSGALLAALGVTGLLALQKRKYEATVTLTAVANSPNLAQSSFLASALGAAGAVGGLRPSPVMITRLATMPGVLREVAISQPDPRRSTRVIDRLLSDSITDIPRYKYAQRVAKFIDISLDRESGLVTVTVAHQDSALARFVARRLLDLTTRTFAGAVQANAEQTRLGLTARVDSSQRQVAAAEGALVAFTRANRVVAPYSEASLELNRLNRAVALAQAIYQQAVTEREAAIGSELESRPVIAVIDSIPPDLLPESRHLALKGIAVAILFELTALGFLLARLVQRHGLEAVFPHGREQPAVPVALSPDVVRVGRGELTDAALSR